MNPSHDHFRKRHARSFSPEMLEGRQLLSAGMGSTFAIMPGTVSKAGDVSSIQFKIDPTQFTPGRGGKILMGFDVAADPSSTLKPEIVSIKNSSGKVMANLHHSTYSPAIIKAQKLGNPRTSAVLMSMPVPKKGAPPENYSIQVRGNFSTTGKYLAGFYLPGDANGDGTVNQEDIKAIKSKFGQSAGSQNYSFDADPNRDGRINSADLRTASQNMGAKTTVSPIIDVKLDPASDTELQDRITSMRDVHFYGTATPDATITFINANNVSPGGSTKVDASGKYSLVVPLADGANNFTVTTSDAFGQSISGAIAPVTYSTNPPKAIADPSQLTTTNG